jgi:hypothetical protein
MPPQYDNEQVNYGGHDGFTHARLATDQLPEMEPMDDTDTTFVRRKSFIAEFVSSNGPPQILILCMLLALGFGSTIGVVPAVMSDRYARLHCE